ncbi:MAG: structural protein [Haliea sp.]|nr:structural protein [Haliea sp.]
MPQLPAVQGFAPLRPGVDQGLPRGIRNNNPGNIRATGTQWAGQVGRDPDFVVFSDPVYGIRAMVRILRSYRARGIVSMGDIIATWAPPHENDTQGYVAFVERETGLGRRQTIGEAEYPALIGAITRKENSINPYSAPQYAAGIAAANTEGVYA